MIRRLRAWLYRKDKERCSGCGRKLTVPERLWYGRRCEECEKRLNKKIMRAVF